MSLNWKLKNRKTGQERIVGQNTWELMQMDGRSRFWTPTPLEDGKPKVEEKPKKVEKEKIKIEPIKVSEVPSEKKEEEVKEKPKRKSYYKNKEKTENEDETN